MHIHNWKYYKDESQSYRICTKCGKAQSAYYDGFDTNWKDHNEARTNNWKAIWRIELEGGENL